MAEAERIKALGEAAEREARDPVNQPTISNWLEAMGDDNPRFRAGEAPPSMAQVWTMPGLGGRPPADDPLHGMMEVLTDEGFTAVLGTNCEQTYDRYLRVGEQVAGDHRARLRGRPEADRDGRGLLRHLAQHLVRRRRAGRDDAVPGAEVQAPKPAVDRGERAGRGIRAPADEEPGHRVLLGRHRRPASCGSSAATPAARCASRPARPARTCGALDRGHVVASGRGTVFSYVVHRHPPVPGPGAADRDRAGRPRRGRPDGRRARRRARPTRSRSGCRCPWTSAGSTRT